MDASEKHKWDLEMVTVTSIVTKAITNGAIAGLGRDGALLAAQIAIFNYMNIEGMSNKIESVVKEALKVSNDTHKELRSMPRSIS